jgi:hypothetical protein
MLSNGQRHIEPGKKLGFGRIIAIQIDENSVQLATSSLRFHRTKLIDCTKIYIPSSLSDESDRKDFIINEISRYIRKYRGRHTRYMLSISGSESSFRMLELPPLSKSELANAVFWEGKKRIPFGLDKAIYGYHVNRKNSKNKGKECIVELVAVPRVVVDRRLNLLEPLGIKFDTICYEPEVIGGLLPYLGNFNENRTFTLIDIKKSETIISFYRGSHLEFLHNCSTGAQALNLDIGITPDDMGISESLLGEIQNALDYYTGQFPGNFTNEVYVYGDLAYSKNLLQILSDNLGLKFVQFPVDFWANRSGKISAMADNIPPALGVTAMTIAKQDIVSLLPPEIREAKSIKRYYTLALAALSVLMIAMAGIWGSLKFQNNLRDTHLKTNRSQIESFKRSESYQTYNRIKRQLAADQAFLTKLKNQPTFLHLNLKELSLITPDKIKIDLFSLRPSPSGKIDLNLAGQAVSSEPPPEVILAEFIAELESSAFFNNIKLTKYSKKQSENGFNLNFRIEMDAVI